ncbi:acyltransferase [Flavihumibacter profundi]|uniref:acyltransferase n=1 Tax=Flavihumibacter profundi TaxID=2716883 RepID=UPI001CC384E6|nr:acyltransferase [Flavihumibacter profundi]MBZ5857987.1 acyltransferase [Flavihumibacter profundi]
MKIIHKLKVFFLELFRYSSHSGSGDLRMHNTVYVALSAKLEVRGGGAIIIGEGTEIMDGVLILTYGGIIQIGKNCSINAYAVLYGHGGLNIGDNVLIAGGTMIIPNQHNYKNKNKLIIEQGCTSSGIIIEDDVWIGHGCSILDGITISKGTVVAAGSVVNKSTEPYSVIGGVPSRLIKYRE